MVEIKYKLTRDRVEGLYKDYARLFTPENISPSDMEKGYETVAERYQLPLWVVKAVISSQTISDFIGRIFQDFMKEKLEKGEITQEGIRKVITKMGFESFRETTEKRVLGAAFYQSPEQNELKKQQGLYWKKIRESIGIEAGELELLMKLEHNSIMDFEEGIISYLDLREGFLDGLAWLLCAEKELKQFKEMYSIQ